MQIIRKSISSFVFSILLLSGNGWGASYYVDQTNGNDSNAGTSTGAAWKTISKVNSSTFSPGDSILFKRGETWKESLAPPSSGVTGNPIIFGAYGSGNAPILTGRDTLAGWNNTSKWNNSANVWRFSYSHHPRHLYLSGTKVWLAENLAGVNSTNKWYWDSGSNLLYVYSTSNPASAFANVEGNVLQVNIDITNKDYITIRDMDLRNARDYDISVYGSHGLTIDNNAVGFDTGFNGIQIQGYPGVHDYSNNAVVSNNTMNTNYGHIDTWRYANPGDGIFLGSGVNGARIYNNTLTDWKHNGITIWNNNNTYTSNNNWVYQNTITAPGVAYGRGFSADSRDSNATGNKFFRNIVRNTNIQNQINMNNFEFYYNIIDKVANSPVNTEDGRCIMLEGYSGTYPTNMKIYNNIFANCAGAGLAIYSNDTDSTYNAVSGNLIKNNIFYNNGYNAVAGRENYQIYMYDTAKILGNTFTNNLFYKSGATDLIYYGHSASNDYPHTVAEFNAENGTASDVIIGNIGGDPLFVSTSDFRLQAGSPARDAGTPVGLTSDFLGNFVPFGTAPDIGVYEYTTQPPPPPPPPPPPSPSKIPASPSNLGVSP